MEKLPLYWLLLTALNAYAGFGGMGNVDDDGGLGGGGNGIWILLAGIFLGAAIGAMWAKFQQSQGKAFATDGGAVIGGLIGMFVFPILYIITK